MYTVCSAKSKLIHGFQANAIAPVPAVVAASASYHRFASFPTAVKIVGNEHTSAGLAKKCYIRISRANP